jgi:hypothetical protein
MGLNVKRQASVALPVERNLVPIVQEALDGHKGGSGRVGKISSIPGWLNKFFQIS